jgi:uncharacterized protein YbjT (DUF2867 family)
MKTLVTGATGTVGGHVMRALVERGANPRAFVRDRAKAVDRHGADADIATGDFADPESLRRALDGVEQMFLTCANHPQQVDWEAAAIDAAATAGVRRVVKLSALGAEIGSPVAFFDAHGRIEAHLRASGRPYVLLRPAFKMSNLLAGARGVEQADAFFAPAAGAKIAMVDPRDVAAAAVAVLGGSGQDGRGYELTGPHAVTFDDVVDELSAILGRRIAFAAVPDDDAVAQFVAAGTPEWYARNVVTQFGLLRQGSQAYAHDVLRGLLGREPHSLGEFLRDHAAAFTKP